MKLSYAQNLEDVVLWRVFSDIECGVYIDVGANSPIVDSVTKLFYDAGWRGVNVEPISSSCEELRKHRPDDINIEKCATGKDGQKLTILNVEATGLSTGVVENKLNFEKMGHEVVEIDVQGTTLSTLWTDADLKDVHFLKIDVEGMEKDVISGVDLTRHRPWVVLVESIDPVHQAPNYLEWESLLLDCDYEFAYFDGLNRFYVAKEKNELKKKFVNPPNIIDDKILENILHISRFVYPEQVKLIESITDHSESMSLTVRDLSEKLDQLFQSNVDLAKRLETLVFDRNELQEALIRKEKVYALSQDEAYTLGKKIQQYESKFQELERRNANLHQVEKEYVAILNSRFWRGTRFIRVLTGLVNRSYKKMRKVVSFFRIHGARHTISKVKSRFFAHHKNMADISVSVSLTEGEKEILGRLTKS